ncbi:MAG TPA: hypothetical protein VKY74_14090 [Chloroflexia bacterium]|nr:hypothetical protein [Chloroflexia bacterium]
MPVFLQRYLSIPQEREYEAWTVQQIEDYFSRIGMRSLIWAVSPRDEVTWPADEHLYMDGKIIGLQFKQTKVRSTQTNTSLDYSRIRWDFANPKGQFSLLQRRKEIFYCLPTFLNRKISRSALEHCIFWRPGCHNDTNAWYNNPRAKTPYKCLAAESRWGHFIERVVSCEVGERIQSRQQINSYLADLQSLFQEYYGQNTDPDNSRTSAFGLYLIYLQL